MDRDLEDDMKNSPWFMEKIKNDSYAQNVYAALCNMRWQPTDVWPVLKDEYWSCSWRCAGGIVADFKGTGDYMDFYCSGMGGIATLDSEADEEFMLRKRFVPEGVVTDEIREDFARLGWHPSPWPKDEV